MPSRPLFQNNNAIVIVRRWNIADGTRIILTFERFICTRSTVLVRMKLQSKLSVMHCNEPILFLFSSIAMDMPFDKPSSLLFLHNPSSLIGSHSTP